MIKSTAVITTLALVLATVPAGRAAVVATVIEAATGISVSVDTDGSYTITSQRPGWTFGGSLRRPLESVVINDARDNLGAYREVAFTYEAGGRRQASIRAYQERPVVLFTVKYLARAVNDAPFPSLATYPRNLYHFTYENYQFSPPTFSELGPNSPWFFFDSNANAFVISPASNFMVANMAKSFGEEIACGVDPELYYLPAGFVHQTLLVVEAGINKAFDTWGRALTDLHGKTRPSNDSDVGLKYLGYWTDNGASYYYDYEPALGYEATLLKIRDYFKQESIPLGYMQIDSWWYPKGPDAHWTQGGGIYRYTAHPSVFPDGLEAFQRKLGLPLIAHARWIDPGSPYRSEFKMSNNVSVDPRYWNGISGYLKNAGVVSYEQDWLDILASAENTIDDQEAFMGNMARATRENGLTLQYCMPTPRHYLQSSKYNNVSTIRVSPDRFSRYRWDHFLYDSRLAGALGIWPWADVFMSTETHNLLLATLSAGMVGVGDRINAVNKANLMRAVRTDGVIVKPDVPIAPSDETFIGDAQWKNQPMVAASHSNHGAIRTLYVFAYDRGSGAGAAFTPASMGLIGRAFVYDYFNGIGQVVNARDTFAEPITGGQAYYVVAPIGPSGIALLGDVDKFVSVGKKRISNLVDNGAVEATIEFARGEGPLTLHGYSPSQPAVSTLKGAIGGVAYDPWKKLFSVLVSPAGDGSAVVRITSQPGAETAPLRGLTAQYYDSADLTNLKLTRIDKTVNFEWGTASPDPSLTRGAFSVRWTGQAVPRYSQTYTFYTTSAEGVRLWINGQKIIDNWVSHTLAENSGTISLTAGEPCDIRMEYYHETGRAVATLSWSSPRQQKQIVPKKRLRTWP